MNDHIFVFGSNRQGRHGKGAALYAMKHYGAKYGVAEGLQGQAYAIITKELRTSRPPVTLEEIRWQVAHLRSFAFQHPELKFYVTPIGCGLAGFKVEDIAPLFAGISAICPNVTLCKEFSEYLSHNHNFPHTPST